MPKALTPPPAAASVNPLPPPTEVAAEAGRIAPEANIKNSLEAAEKIRLATEAPAPPAPFRQYNTIVVRERHLPADLSAALDLARNPGRWRTVQRQPLPRGVLRLIRIAGGGAASLEEAAALSGKDPAFIQASAAFYLEQALWSAPGDSYRTLGAVSTTPQEVLPEHFEWLMKWLGPYAGGTEREADFAARVLAAWETVKTPELRARYDRSLAAAYKTPSVSRARKG